MATQVLACARLGFTHSTFLSLAVETAEAFVPDCSPKGLADLAVGFSQYRLPTGDLYGQLLAAAVDKLVLFDELQLLRLLDGLSARQGLHLTPLMQAAQVSQSLPCCSSKITL